MIFKKKNLLANGSEHEVPHTFINIAGISPATTDGPVNSLYGPTWKCCSGAVGKGPYVADHQ